MPERPDTARAAIRAMPSTPSSSTPEVSELVERLRQGRLTDLSYSTRMSTAAALETLEARVKVLEGLLRRGTADLSPAERKLWKGKARAALLKQLSGEKNERKNDHDSGCH